MQEPNDMQDDDDYVTDDSTPALPWWKRPLIMGLDAIWLGGITLALVLAAVYLLQREMGSQDAGNPAFSDITIAESVPVPSAAASPVTLSAVNDSDIVSLTSDLKAELDARDKTLNDSLSMMQDSLRRLSEAMRRDENYARETRKQLDALQATVSGLQTTPAASSSAPAVKKKASAVSGMKVVSMESGMAWIRWQGSTWAVREGDTLGKVTITRIDPASRTLHTSGGTVR